MFFYLFSFASLSSRTTVAGWLDRFSRAPRSLQALEDMHGDKISTKQLVVPAVQVRLLPALSLQNQSATFALRSWGKGRRERPFLRTMIFW